MIHERFSNNEGGDGENIFNSISFGVDVFFMMFSDGSFTYSRQLYDRLKDMLLEQNTSGVDVLALGDKDKFKDGEERWRVSDSLADVLVGRNCSRGRGFRVGVALGGGGDYCV